MHKLLLTAAAAAIMAPRSPRARRRADAGRHQEARHAGRRRQGRLQAVRLPRPVGRDRRPRARPGARRRQEARRQAGAGAGGLVQPHAVPESGQDRPDDRDDDDKPDRRKVVGIIEPLYYGSGVNVLAPKKAGLKSWEQLKGKKVCGIQGAWYNKPVAEKYGAGLVAFKGLTEADVALKNGNCVGCVYDDTAFAERLADPKWAGYEMPLPTIMESRGASR